MTGRSVQGQGMYAPKVISAGASLAVVTLLLAATLGRADYVFMTDGQALRGRVLREGDVIRDPFGGPIWSPKLGGFFLIDDQVRRVVLSPRHVAEAREDPPDRGDIQDVYRFKPILNLVGQTPPRYIKVQEAGPWKTNGERTLVVEGIKPLAGEETRTIEQCILELTPKYFTAHTRKARWQCNYLTTEMDATTAREIVRQQSAKAGGREADQTRAMLRFCLQAGWLDDAEALVREHDTRFAAEKERIEELRKELQRLNASRKLQQLELAYQAGAHGRAERILTGTSGEGATDQVLNALHSFRQRYKERNANLQTTRRLLASVRREANDLAGQPGLVAPCAEIERDLNLDTLPRLDAFLSLAKQEERNRAASKPAELAPEQLIALAVSGWLLGNAGAEAHVGMALKLWKTREFLLKYLRAPSARERSALLTEYSRGEALPVDVITLLLELLPPAQNGTPSPTNPFEANTRPDDLENGVPYYIELPPEYHPHRSYPLLIALPNVRELPRTMHERWAALAAEHGCILVSPRWYDVLATDYQYTEKEQQTVLDTIRDVKRRFNVDSERVFLSGFGWSGAMAYDMGMSHPDVFAGVVTMCCQPGRVFHPQKNNVQYLPIYAVEGEKDFNGPKENRAALRHWVQSGYPCMYVEYGGRGFEFYQAELPFIFDWMKRKRRAPGLPELGKAPPVGAPSGQVFASTRPSNNRFYWLSSDDFTPPAQFTARIAESNVILAQVSSNVRQLSVWLNAGMVDFDQPVEVRVNAGSITGKTFKKRVEPSLAVLLQDYYERRDRKGLFVGRVDFDWRR